MNQSEEDQQMIIEQVGRQLADIIYQYIQWREKQKLEKGGSEDQPLSTQP
jgi:hypothetical protein